eukprot:scaffold61839_cov69-Phaeocystis_antarctica.AAC.4
MVSMATARIAIVRMAIVSRASRPAPLGEATGSAAATKPLIKGKRSSLGKSLSWHSPSMYVAPPASAPAALTPGPS